MQKLGEMLTYPKKLLYCLASKSNKSIRAFGPICKDEVVGAPKSSQCHNLRQRIAVYDCDCDAFS